MSAGLQPITDRDFDRVVEHAPVPVLVEFWKPGCGHCRALTAELERLQAIAGGRVLVFAMNAGENYQIPAELEITTLPALALYEKGRFQRFIGGIGKRDDILKELGLDAAR
jgi:thioredoxin 1